MTSWLRPLLTFPLVISLALPFRVMGEERNLLCLQSAASLNREQYAAAVAEIKATNVHTIFHSFNRKMNTFAVWEYVRNKYNASEWRRYMKFEEVRGFVEGWIVLLVLSRQGYFEAGVNELEDHLAGIVVGMGKHIRAHRHEGFTLEVAEEMLGQLLAWTVEGALAEFGFLKRHEMERIFSGLVQASESLQSDGFEKKIRDRLGNPMANNNFYGPVSVVALFVSMMATGVGTIGVAIHYSDMIREFGVAGFLAAVVVIAGTAVGIPVAISCGVNKIGYLRGVCRAKMRNLRTVAQRCASMLTSSGEIVP